MASNFVILHCWILQFLAFCIHFCLLYSLSSSHIYLFPTKIVINSSSLISMSISACNIKASILLYLLLVSISIWSCLFFFIIVVLSNFLMIPVVIEKIKVELALAIPAGTPIILVNEIIDTPLLDMLKTIFCLCNQK